MRPPIRPQGSRIIGTGSALPGSPVSNAKLVSELAARGVQTSDSWIVERTGIRQRYLRAGSDHVGARCAGGPVRLAGGPGAADSIDLIVLATSTPDQIFPSTACLVQAELGIRGAAAFDLQAVCSGFVYG